jgi:hypothetical protein
MSDLIDTDSSARGALRKAVALSQGGDTIELSLEAAMGLLMETGTFRRTAMATILDSVELKPVESVNIGDGDTPFFTHEGVLNIGSARIRVYQLSDGQRIIPCEDLEAFFGEIAEGQ